MEKVVSILEKSQDEVNKDTKVLGNNLENSNIIDIMMIRLNNTLAEADKAELLKDKNCFEKLNDFVFDQNIGYLVCSLMDGTLRVSSKKNIILSYEYDSIAITPNKK